MITKKVKSETKSATSVTQTTRIFDVVRPGTMPAATVTPHSSATSRPIVVTHRSVMQDPMMISRPTAGSDPESLVEQAPPRIQQKIIIKPLSDNNEAELNPATTPPKTVTPNQPTKLSVSFDGDIDGLLDVGSDQASNKASKAPLSKSDTPVTNRLEQIESTGPEESKAAIAHKSNLRSVLESSNSGRAPAAATTATAASSKSHNVDTPSEANARSTQMPYPASPVPGQESDKAADENSTDSELVSPKATVDIETARLEADAKAQDELDTLVDQKTYFLPINSVEQRRSRHIAVLGAVLILVLAAAWLDVAIDAGIVTLPGVKPITHLFQN